MESDEYVPQISQFTNVYCDANTGGGLSGFGDFTAANAAASQQQTGFLPGLHQRQGFPQQWRTAIPPGQQHAGNPYAVPGAQQAWMGQPRGPNQQDASRFGSLQQQQQAFNSDMMHQTRFTAVMGPPGSYPSSYSQQHMQQMGHFQDPGGYGMGQLQQQQQQQPPGAAYMSGYDMNSALQQQQYRQLHQQPQLTHQMKQQPGDVMSFASPQGRPSSGAEFVHGGIQTPGSQVDFGQQLQDPFPGPSSAVKASQQHQPSSSPFQHSMSSPMSQQGMSAGGNMANRTTPGTPQQQVVGSSQAMGIATPPPAVPMHQQSMIGSQLMGIPPEAAMQPQAEIDASSKKKRPRTARSPRVSKKKQQEAAAAAAAAQAAVTGPNAPVVPTGTVPPSYNMPPMSTAQAQHTLMGIDAEISAMEQAALPLRHQLQQFQQLPPQAQHKLQEIDYRLQGLFSDKQRLFHQMRVGGPTQHWASAPVPGGPGQFGPARPPMHPSQTMNQNVYPGHQQQQSSLRQSINEPMVSSQAPNLEAALKGHLKPELRPSISQQPDEHPSTQFVSYGQQQQMMAQQQFSSAAASQNTTGRSFGSVPVGWGGGGPPVPGGGRTTEPISPASEQQQHNTMYSMQNYQQQQRYPVAGMQGSALSIELTQQQPPGSDLPPTPSMISPTPAKQQHATLASVVVPTAPPNYIMQQQPSQNQYAGGSMYDPSAGPSTFYHQPPPQQVLNAGYQQQQQNASNVPAVPVSASNNGGSMSVVVPQGQPAVQLNIQAPPSSQSGGTVVTLVRFGQGEQQADPTGQQQPQQWLAPSASAMQQQQQQQNNEIPPEPTPPAHSMQQSTVYGGYANYGAQQLSQQASTGTPSTLDDSPDKPKRKRVRRKKSEIEAEKAAAMSTDPFMFTAEGIEDEPKPKRKRNRKPKPSGGGDNGGVTTTSSKTTKTSIDATISLSSAADPNIQSLAAPVNTTSNLYATMPLSSDFGGILGGGMEMPPDAPIMNFQQQAPPPTFSALAVPPPPMHHTEHSTNPLLAMQSMQPESGVVGALSGLVARVPPPAPPVGGTAITDYSMIMPMSTTEGMFSAADSDMGDLPQLPSGIQQTLSMPPIVVPKPPLVDDTNELLKQPQPTMMINQPFVEQISPASTHSGGISSMSLLAADHQPPPHHPSTVVATHGFSVSVLESTGPLTREPALMVNELPYAAATVIGEPQSNSNVVADLENVLGMTQPDQDVAMMAKEEVDIKPVLEETTEQQPEATTASTSSATNEMKLEIDEEPQLDNPNLQQPQPTCFLGFEPPLMSDEALPKNACATTLLMTSESSTSDQQPALSNTIPALEAAPAIPGAVVLTSRPCSPDSEARAESADSTYIDETELKRTKPRAKPRRRRPATKKKVFNPRKKNKKAGYDSDDSYDGEGTRPLPPKRGGGAKSKKVSQSSLWMTSTTSSELVITGHGGNGVAVDGSESALNVADFSEIVGELETRRSCRTKRRLITDETWKVVTNSLSDNGSDENDSGTDEEGGSGVVAGGDDSTTGGTTSSVPFKKSKSAKKAATVELVFIDPAEEESQIVDKIFSIRPKMIPNPKFDETAAVVENEELAKEVEVEEFYVKYKNFSYMHCEWKTEAELECGDKRVGGKIKRFKTKRDTVASYLEMNEEEPFNPEYLQVERVLAQSVDVAIPSPKHTTEDVSDDVDPVQAVVVGDEGVENVPPATDEHPPVLVVPETKEEQLIESVKPTKMVTHYLIKWLSLAYEECTWELEDDVDPLKIEEFHKRNKMPPWKKSRVPRPKSIAWAKVTEQRQFKGGNLLRDYQHEGVNWLLYCYYHKRNCILADEMGLGKTIQTITFLSEAQRIGITGPFLVIAPLSTIMNWQREFERWTDMNALVYHGTNASRRMIQEYEFFYRDPNLQRTGGAQVFKFDAIITTYEMILTDYDQLQVIDWRITVIDEAHRLKNKNCKLLAGLATFNMEHRVLLTGTPLQNNVSELFSLLNFLEPDQFHNQSDFLVDFGNLQTDEQCCKLQAILKPMMLRRLKEDVEKSLAAKEETIIEVELTNMQKKYYRAILERNFSFISKGASVPSLMNTMMELRKCCNHPFLIKGAEDQILLEYQPSSATEPEDVQQLNAMIQSSGKLVLIDKLLPRLKDTGHKVLIFSQMVRCLDILEEYLITRKYTFERIDGNIRGDMRQAAIDRFSKPESDRFVFLLCTRAGGLGINLTAADTVIIFDSDWNPQNDLQAQARCHRIGQLKEVKVYRLITRNSYEREMFDKASKKLGLDKAILQSMHHNKEQMQPQLSKKDVEELLKKGAYGALMDETNEADRFCEEDIDQILQRRTQTIKIESAEQKGSSFAKASFACSDNRSDIDINDPNFWQKWAKKADIDEDALNPEKNLIIYEPRQRKRRFEAENMYQQISDHESDSNGERGAGDKNAKNKTNAEDDSDSDSDGGPRKRNRKQRGKYRQKMNENRDLMYSRTDYMRAEKYLGTFGWSRWTEIKTSAQMTEYSDDEIEMICRTILLQCLRQYQGDDKIREFIWDVITPVEYQRGGKLSLDQPSVSGKGGRKRNTQAGGGQQGRTLEPLIDRLHKGWAALPEYNPPILVIDTAYQRHMLRHANKILLRVRLLYYLKQEIIGDLSDLIMTGSGPNDLVGFEPPWHPEIPVDWWDQDADKSLLIGIYKHGFENIYSIRCDSALCFVERCGLPTEVQITTATGADGQAISKEPEASGSGGETVEDGAKVVDDADSVDEETVVRLLLNELCDSVVTTDDDDNGEVRKSDEQIEKSDQNEELLTFPTTAEVNARFRKLVTLYQRTSKQSQIRQEQQAKKAAKFEQFQAALQQREHKRLEDRQKWSRREELDFCRTLVSYGIRWKSKRRLYDWDQFRNLARLEAKYDQTLTDYCNSYIAMCKRVSKKTLSKDEERAPFMSECLTDEKAIRILQRIDQLSAMRDTLNLPDCGDRLASARRAPDFPSWWEPGKHDYEMMRAVEKYGLTKSEEGIAYDDDFVFAGILRKLQQDALMKQEEELLKKEKQKNSNLRRSKRGGGKRGAGSPSANEEDSLDGSEEAVGIGGTSIAPDPELTISEIIARQANFGVSLLQWPKERQLASRIHNLCSFVESGEWPSLRGGVSGGSFSLGSPLVDMDGPSLTPDITPICTPGPSVPSTLLSEDSSDVPSPIMGSDMSKMSNMIFQSGSNSNNRSNVARGGGRRGRKGASGSRSGLLSASASSGARTPVNRREQQQQQAQMNAAFQSVGKFPLDSFDLSAFSGFLDLENATEKEKEQMRAILHQAFLQQMEQSGAASALAALLPSTSGLSMGTTGGQSGEVLNLSTKQQQPTKSGARSAASQKKGLDKQQQQQPALLPTSNRDTPLPFNDLNAMSTLSPDTAVPVINLKDGSRRTGNDAPTLRNLAQWLNDHPHYIIDMPPVANAAFEKDSDVEPGEIVVASVSSTSQTSTSAASQAANSVSKQQAAAVGDDPLAGVDIGLGQCSEDLLEQRVAVMNRKSGDALSGQQAPKLSNLQLWLESNPEWEVDMQALMPSSQQQQSKATTVVESGTGGGGANSTGKRSSGGKRATPSSSIGLALPTSSSTTTSATVAEQEAASMMEMFAAAAMMPGSGPFGGPNLPSDIDPMQLSQLMAFSPFLNQQQQANAANNSAATASLLMAAGAYGLPAFGFPGSSGAFGGAGADFNALMMAAAGLPAGMQPLVVSSGASEVTSSKNVSKSGSSSITTMAQSNKKADVAKTSAPSTLSSSKPVDIKPKMSDKQSAKRSGSTSAKQQDQLAAKSAQQQQHQHHAAMTEAAMLEQMTMAAAMASGINPFMFGATPQFDASGAMGGGMDSATLSSLFNNPFLALAGGGMTPTSSSSSVAVSSQQQQQQQLNAALSNPQTLTAMMQLQALMGSAQSGSEAALLGPLLGLPGGLEALTGGAAGDLAQLAQMQQALNFSPRDAQASSVKQVMTSSVESSKSAKEKVSAASVSSGARVSTSGSKSSTKSGGSKLNALANKLAVNASGGSGSKPNTPNPDSQASANKE